jgi:Zinc finger C-x8-C-x5-C-x3-H type (and similar)
MISHRLDPLISTSASQLCASNIYSSQTQVHIPHRRKQYRAYFAQRYSVSSHYSSFLTGAQTSNQSQPQLEFSSSIFFNFFKMALHLASIFGTEMDKVNCSFYYKIGACRHGDRCSRKHVKPSYSQTILLPNLYQNPAYDPKNKMNASQLQNHFDAFYEDFWCEMCKYGEIEEVVVCDNNNDRKSPLPLICI